MDIVERLRQEIGGYTDTDIEKAEADMQESADEIERLREDKAELVEALEIAADGFRDCGAEDLEDMCRAVIAKTTGGEG